LQFGFAHDWQLRVSLTVLKWQIILCFSSDVLGDVLIGAVTCATTCV